MVGRPCGVQVGSADSEIFFKETRRQTLVTQTLHGLMLAVIFTLPYGYRSDLQSTERKDRDQGDLLSLRDLQSDQGWNRNDQNGQVGSNVHGRVGEPQPLLIQAVARDGWVPEFGHRNAVEETAQDRPRSICCQNTYHDPRDSAHPGCLEDAIVLQEDRRLGAQQRSIVEGDRDPEGLPHTVRHRAVHYFPPKAALPSSVSRGFQVGCRRHASLYR